MWFSPCRLNLLFLGTCEFLLQYEIFCFWERNQLSGFKFLLIYTQLNICINSVFYCWFFFDDLSIFLPFLLGIVTGEIFTTTLSLSLSPSVWYQWTVNEVLMDDLLWTRQSVICYVSSSVVPFGKFSCSLFSLLSSSLSFQYW